MFTELHCCEADYSVVVIRYSYCNCIKMFVFLFKQFTPVVVIRSFWKFFTTGGCLPVIYVTKKGYYRIFLRGSGIMMNIIFRLAAASNCRNVELITWSYKS